MAELDSFFNTPRGADPSSFYSGISALAKSAAPTQNALSPSTGGPWSAVARPVTYTVVPDPYVGARAVYAPTPYIASSVNRLAPDPPFAYAPTPGGIDYAALAATQNGLNLLDPGNEGYDAYMAGKAAEELANGAVEPETNWLQDMVSGVLSAVTPKVAAKPNLTLPAPPAEGLPFQTLGQLMTRANDPVSRSSASQGVNASGNYYNLDTNKWVMQGAGGKIDGNPDNATFSSADGGEGPWSTYGFKNAKAYKKAYRDWLNTSGAKDNAAAESAFWSHLRQQQRAAGSTSMGSTSTGRTSTGGAKPSTPAPPTKPTTTTSEQYDRFGTVVFPDMPPYKPGVDGEWLYFRKQLARGGIVGYADGGAVGAADTMDPRVQVIADAEDAIEDAVSGEGIDGEGEAAIRKFVGMFGEEAMTSLVEQVRRGMKMRQRTAPGRQVFGPGGPTDDGIPALIDGQQPAALSSGEFVMPVAAVEGAGGGDVMAGARELEALSQSLQKRKA